VQILWINLLDSVLLTMPLMMERKERDLLKAPPRAADEGIINARFIQRLLVLGLAISIPGFAVYYHFGASAVIEGQLVDAVLLTQAQTAAFWGVLLGHIGYVVSARSLNDSAFSFSPFSNPWLLGGIAISILIRLIPTALPVANELFRTAPFPLAWWPYILACFFPSFIAIEVLKVWQRRQQ
ncbi:MAG: cation-translocating P-type ATPase C-terminal domain-containing protein, partial [Pseudohongiellaceae bacterium]